MTTSKKFPPLPSSNNTFDRSSSHQSFPPIPSPSIHTTTTTEMSNNNNSSYASLSLSLPKSEYHQEASNNNNNHHHVESLTSHTKQLIYDLLVTHKVKYKILHRKDDVYIHTQHYQQQHQQHQQSQSNSSSSSSAKKSSKIAGCLFLIEQILTPVQQIRNQPIIYLLWVPYLLLVQWEDGILVNHTRKNGRVVTRAEYMHLITHQSPLPKRRTPSIDFPLSPPSMNHRRTPSQNNNNNNNNNNNSGSNSSSSSGSNNAVGHQSSLSGDNATMTMMMMMNTMGDENNVLQLTEEMLSGASNVSIPCSSSNQGNNNNSSSSSSVAAATSSLTFGVNPMVSRAEEYAIAVRMEQVLNIKKHSPSIGHSYIIITQQQPSQQSANHHSRSVSSHSSSSIVDDGFEEISEEDIDMNSVVSHPPLYFHEGGVNDFLSLLQRRNVIAVMPNDSHLYKVLLIPSDDTAYNGNNIQPSSPINANNKQLERSLNQMQFDSYFDHVCYPEEPTSTAQNGRNINTSNSNRNSKTNTGKSSSVGSSNGWLVEWGAKVYNRISSTNQSSSKYKVPSSLPVPNVSSTYISMNNIHMQPDEVPSNNISDSKGSAHLSEQGVMTGSVVNCDIKSVTDHDYLLPNEQEAEDLNETNSTSVTTPDDQKQSETVLTETSIDNADEDGFEIIEEPTKSDRSRSPPLTPASPVVDTDERFAILASILHPKYSETPKLNRAQWEMLFDEFGSQVPDAKAKWSAICLSLYYGGIEENDEQLRSEVWKYLLGYYSFDENCRTVEQREALERERAILYDSVKSQWTSITPLQERYFSLYRERKGRIDKDVVRTDRNVDIFIANDSQYLDKLRNILLTYGMWNFDLGYCQGMGDLLSPLLHVIRDESQTFWCFVCLMETPASLDTSFTFNENDLFEVERQRLEGNGSGDIRYMQCSGHFEMNSKYMEKQLNKLQQITKVLDKDWYEYLEKRDAVNFYFCFRWILVLLKREFTFNQIKNLWERVWSLGFNLRNPSQKPCPVNDFFLYIAYGILRHYKHEMMEMHQDWAFDDILKFCVNISHSLDVDDVLKDAETAYSMYVGYH